MSIAAVIVAAGRGTRARATADDASGPTKQYAQIDGQAVLSRTIRAFATHPAINHIQVVIHADDQASYQTMLSRDGEHAKLRAPVVGGPSRQESVHTGLTSLAGAANDEPDHVLIHDAARPFLDHGTIDRVLAALETHDGAIAALPVADTLLRTGAEDVVTGRVDREGIWRAQTPQGFAFPAILNAHTKAAAEAHDTFTDDASLFEWAGGQVRVVPGSEENIKITTAEDLIMAQSGAHATPVPQVRVGTGFDVHRCGPGDHVWLCGVKIPAEFALVGHSDADVALHALTDAILGALGDGDIGHHFPPSDDTWKGAASAQFLADAQRRITARGGTLNNVDVTLICERPKIGPHRDAMRAELSRILTIPIDRVSVKATTSEQLGFTGRGEGLAAMATATVSLP